MIGRDTHMYWGRFVGPSRTVPGWSPARLDLDPLKFIPIPLRHFLVRRPPVVHRFDRSTEVQGDLIADAQGWDGTYGAPFATDWDNDGGCAKKKHVRS